MSSTTGTASVVPTVVVAGAHDENSQNRGLFGDLLGETDCCQRVGLSD